MTWTDPYPPLAAKMPSKKKGNKKKGSKKQKQQKQQQQQQQQQQQGITLTQENAGILFSEPIVDPNADPVSDAEKKARADKFKTLGNEAFKAKEYKQAVKHFSDAISWDTSNHVYFSNRSAAQIYCGKFKSALRDALKCVQLKPQWAKGYSRLGTAQFYLQNYNAAIGALQKGLALEPTNEGMKTMLAKSEGLFAEQQAREAEKKVGRSLLSATPVCLSFVFVLPHPHNITALPCFALRRVHPAMTPLFLSHGCHCLHESKNDPRRLERAGPPRPARSGDAGASSLVIVGLGVVVCRHLPVSATLGGSYFRSRLPDADAAPDTRTTFPRLSP